MAKYFTQDMVYDTNYFDGTNKYMGNGTGIWRYAAIFFLISILAENLNSVRSYLIIAVLLGI